MATLDRLLRDGKWGAISRIEFLDRVVEKTFIVPSKAPIDGQFNGWDPLVFDHDGNYMVGVFSNRDLAAKYADQAPHLSEVHAWSLIKALKPEFGILLNPGEEFGFIFPPTNLAEMRRLKGAF